MSRAFLILACAAATSASAATNPFQLPDGQEAIRHLREAVAQPSPLKDALDALALQAEEDFGGRYRGPDFPGYETLLIEDSGEVRTPTFQRTYVVNTNFGGSVHTGYVLNYNFTALVKVDNLGNRTILAFGPGLEPRIGVGQSDAPRDYSTPAISADAIPALAVRDSLAQGGIVAKVIGTLDEAIAEGFGGRAQVVRMDRAETLRTDYSYSRSRDGVETCSGTYLVNVNAGGGVSHGYEHNLNALFLVKTECAGFERIRATVVGGRVVPAEEFAELL